MGQHGREFVEQSFDERLVIGRYLEVVAEIAAPQAGLALGM